MTCKQHALFLVLSLFTLACTHESAASGSNEAQTPKAEPAPETAELQPEPAADSGKNAKLRACNSDEDCHVVDVYCGGCTCVAQLTSMSAAKCPGQEVQCFAQPCRGQHAVCKSGACSLSVSAGEQ